MLALNAHKTVIFPMFCVKKLHPDTSTLYTMAMGACQPSSGWLNLYIFISCFIRRVSHDNLPRYSSFTELRFPVLNFSRVQKKLRQIIFVGVGSIFKFKCS